MYKRLLLIIAIVLFSASLSAQLSHFKYGANIGLGISQVKVQFDEFSTMPGINTNAHFFVDYYFTQFRGVTGHWGASLGLGVNRYSSVLDAGSYNAVFSEGTDLTGDYQISLYSNDWQDKVALTSLSIPVGLLYKINLTRFLSLRTLLGVNIELPLAFSSKRTQGSLSTNLYYPAYMKDPSEAVFDVPEFGCYDQRIDWDNVSDFSAHKLDVSLYFETGMTYKLKRRQSFTYRKLSVKYGKLTFFSKMNKTTKRTISLTTNLYMGVGLRKASSGSNDNLLVATSATDFSYRSPASYASTHAIYAGIKLGLCFGQFGRRYSTY